MSERIPEVHKKLMGTYRPSRERKGLELEAGTQLPEAPEPPETLSEAAKEHWRELAPLLIDMEVLAAADVPTLKLCCKTLATCDELEAAISKEGFTIEAATGGRKAHPALKALESQRNAAARLLASFGLSPKARKYVDKAPTPRKDGPWAKFRKTKANLFDNLDDDFEDL